MYYDQKIWVGDANGEKISILPNMANRHGLIAGATGTGKTITLKVLAESFSDAGVPVFLADIKGDLSGMCRPGADTEDMRKRIQRFGLAETGFQYQAYPSVFWDIYGEMGIPVRTTISEMGPLLLSKLLGLNTTQADILTVVFKIADDENLLLIDTKDLKAMLQYVAENNAEYSAQYGNIAKNSINAILRGVVALESKGGEQFFGEPALNIADWFTSEGGKGTINILDCRTLMNDASLYSTFLLWMLSELFETLPEVGDPAKPRMVFFFDEAHLLFKGISKPLEDKIEQVVKLIRSKGVGVYFITQNPKDIPDAVLAQLGNKIQHALRAYTPAEEKAVKAAAQSFRANPDFDTREALMELGTGEALVSVLDAKGIPGMVQRCKILPPQSLMGAIADEDKKNQVLASNTYLRYKEMYDRDSAFEFLSRKNELLTIEREKQMKAEAEAKEAAKAAEKAEKEAEKARIAAEKEEERAKAAAAKEAAKQAEKEAKEAAKAAEKAEKEAAKAAEKAEKEAAKEQEKKEKAKKQSIKNVGNSVAGTVGREVGNAVGNAVGGKFGKKIGGNLGAALGRSILGTFLKG